jgi:hypothetical protein
MKNSSMQAPQITAGFWLGVNVLGAAVFLFIASPFWTEPELKEFPGASGSSPILWGLFALPVVTLFAFLNIGLLAWAIVVRKRLSRWPVSKLLWLVVPLWLATYIFDNVHH